MHKKIGILGSGQVAKALSDGFIAHGYDVMVGSRDVSKLANLTSTAGKIQTGNFTETATFGDIVVLAVKGKAAEDVATSVAAHIAGKTVIDTTNPIADAPPQNGVLKYFTTLDLSLMERLQSLVPAANFVKAFNCVGNTLMVNPQVQGGKPTMFICGNSDKAKKEVNVILDQFSWEVADLGKAEAARAIEPLCMLWCIPGFLNNQWNHAFKIVKP